MPLRLANPAAMEAPLRRGLRLSPGMFPGPMLTPVDILRHASSTHVFRSDAHDARSQSRAARPAASPDESLDVGGGHGRAPGRDASAGASQSVRGPLVSTRALRLWLARE